MDGPWGIDSQSDTCLEGADTRGRGEQGQISARDFGGVVAERAKTQLNEIDFSFRAPSNPPSLTQESQSLPLSNPRSAAWKKKRGETASFWLGRYFYADNDGIDGFLPTGSRPRLSYWRWKYVGEGHPLVGLPISIYSLASPSFLPSSCQSVNSTQKVVLSFIQPLESNLKIKWYFKHFDHLFLSWNLKKK